MSDRCPTCGHAYLAPEVERLKLKALEDDGDRLILEEKIHRLEPCADALRQMLKWFGSPKRDEWLSDESWEQAVIVRERAQYALDGLKE